MWHLVIELLVSSVMPLLVRLGMIAWVSQRRDAKEMTVFRCKSCQMQYLRFLKPLY